MNKPIKLSKAQVKAIKALDDPRYRRYLFDGSARSGKTLVTILWLLNQMATIPGLRVACLRKHRNHARTTLLEATIRPLIANRTDFEINETQMEIKHTNGSVMMIDGLDDAERVDKILGNEFGHLFINESTQVDYNSVKVAISRLAQNIEGLNKRVLILDCNPRSPQHWIHKVAIEHIDPETLLPLNDANVWYRQHWTTLDNPHLPKDTIESLKNLTGTERKRLYEGLWVSVDGLVYPEFETDLHVIDEVYKDEDIDGYVCGVDCGNNDPMIMALFQIVNIGDFRDHPKLHLIELFWKKGVDMSVSLGDVAEKWRDKDPMFFIDPSASPAIVELKSRNFRVEPATNKIKEGITVVKDLLKTNRLTISRKVSNLDKLLEEFSTYELNPITEKPTGDTPDHCLDGLRYACVGWLDSLSEGTSDFYIF